MTLTCSKCTHSIPEDALYVSETPGSPPICLNCIPEADRNEIIQQFIAADGVLCSTCHRKPPKGEPYVTKDNMTLCLSCIPEEEKKQLLEHAETCSCCTQGQLH